MSPRVSHLQPVAAAPTPTSGAGAARVREAIAGDPDAWAELYAETYPALFRQLRYLTGDDAVAEELAQETFARAIAGAARYDPRREFSAWVYGIGLNVVRKHWRKRSNTTKAHANLRLVSTVAGHDRQGSPLEGQVQRQRSQMLYDLLQGLPHRWREAFILREVEGLSVEETATRLGISPKNVTVRATRARARLREEIRRRGWSDGTEDGG